MVGIALLIAAAAAQKTPPPIVRNPLPPVTIQAVPTPPPVYVPSPIPGIERQVSIDELPSNKETLAYSKVGNWHVRIDMTIAAGCFAYLSFEDGTALRFSIAPATKTILMMIGNQLWRSIDKGTTAMVGVRFGSSQIWTANASGALIGNMHFLAFRITDGKIVSELRNNWTMAVASEQRKIGVYDVRDADRAIDQVAACQKLVESTVDPFAKK